jgi:hypothetical protein
VASGHSSDEGQSATSDKRARRLRQPGQGTRWYDGIPSTANDVLGSVDLMLYKAKGKVRFNPRKFFYKNLVMPCHFKAGGDLLNHLNGSEH